VIRDFQTGDAREVADLLDKLEEGPVAPEGLVHHVESMPARADACFLVAVQDEAVVGWTEARRKWSSDPAIGKFRVVVRPSARRQGFGSALFERALEHLAALGVTKLVTYDGGTEEAARFVTARGFEPARRTLISVLEPQPVWVAPPTGARLRALGEVSVRGEELFDLYRAAEEDLPSDDVHGRMTLEEWSRETLAHPLLDQEGSFVVEMDSRLAAFTFLLVDRERGQAENEMTGTLPELRGRGLATVAKRAAIAWAAEHGVREIWTGNDADNAPMLAINRGLGYRPVKTLTDYYREGETASGPERAEPGR
jgi:GNAT superfamily N-acetyltransferase